jgi:hypothetical protein
MSVVVTKNTKSFQHTSDKIEDLLHSIGLKRKKYFFIYDGIKFVSDKEIIGVEPKTYKLIYKNEN